MKPTRIWTAAALGAVATVGACMVSATPDNTAEDRPVQGRHYADGGAKDDNESNTGANVSPPGATEDETLATFTPAEVATLLEVINLGEVTQGQLAVQQAQDPQVKAFAQHMVEAHGKGEERAQRLLGQTTSSSEPQKTRLAKDPTAGVLLHQGEVLTKDLKTHTGPVFDLEYMTAQVMGHAKVLGLIDQALLPSAQATQPSQHDSVQGRASPPPEVNAADLQAELKATRADVVKHLVEALRIQKALRAPSGATPPPGGTPPPSGGTTPPPT